MTPGGLIKGNQIKKSVMETRTMYTVLHLQKLGLKNCKTKVFTPRCQRHCVVNFQHKYLRDIGSIFENSLACQPHRNVLYPQDI